MAKPLKTNNSFKPKIAIVLLIIVIILNAISVLVLFQRIETIIHGDLYRYGLHTSSEWINPITDSSYLFVNCVTFATILMVIAVSSLAILNIERNTILRPVSTFLVTAGAGINLFSLYPIYRIDQMVNSYLYSFGLQFNEAWYTSYELYTMQLLGFILFASAISTVSIVIVATSARKNLGFVPESLVSSVLIIIGTISLALSIIYTSSLLALIGIGILSLGGIFTYISNEEYVKKILLDTSTSSQLEMVNRLIQEADLAGIAAFLPPKYFKIPEAYKVYISKQKSSKLPAPETFYKIDPRFPYEFIEKPPAILITPPGAELVMLFEKELKTNFLRVDLHYLEDNLPELLTENLQVVKYLEINIEDTAISVRIEGSVYKRAEVIGENPGIYFSFISPLTNAIACVLAKVSGKPIMEVKRQIKSDGEVIIVEYCILKEDESNINYDTANKL